MKIVSLCFLVACVLFGDMKFSDPQPSFEHPRKIVVQISSDKEEDIHHILGSLNNIIKEYRNYLWMVDKNGKVLNEEEPGCMNHHMSGIRYALSTLGRLKQELSYWDRIFAEELSSKSKKLFNKSL
jgi:hypothetical protein